MARCTADKLRFLNRNTNKTYSSQINKWVEEIISMYGTRVDYYVYEYDKSRHDFLYGEDNPARFSDPIPMTMYCKVNSDALTLSKYGLQTQAEMEAYITISGFAAAMGNPHAFPKAGDLIRMTEAGMDRPGGGGYPQMEETSAEDGTVVCSATSGTDTCDPTANSYEEVDISPSALNMDNWLRGPNIYEITEARDDDFANGLNPMMVHNVWKLKAIRFDNSYQPNAPKEAGQNMVNDSIVYGKLPGGTDPQTPQKTYIGTSDKEATNKYWQYNAGLDKVYGGYGGVGSIDGNKEGVSATDVTYDPTKDPYSSEYAETFDGLPLLDTVSAVPHLAEAVHEDLTTENGGLTTGGKPTHFDIKVRRRFK